MDAKYLKFNNYLIEGFGINLRTILGLGMPSQMNAVQLSQCKYWFWSNIFGPESPDPYVCVLHVISQKAQGNVLCGLFRLPLTK